MISQMSLRYLPVYVLFLFYLFPTCIIYLSFYIFVFSRFYFFEVVNWLYIKEPVYVQRDRENASVIRILTHREAGVAPLSLACAAGFAVDFW